MSFDRINVNILSSLFIKFDKTIYFQKNPINYVIINCQVQNDIRYRLKNDGFSHYMQYILLGVSLLNTSTVLLRMN